MTDVVYRWFVERCLRLELEIAVLKGLETALPQIERRALHTDPRPPIRARFMRRIQHDATPDEIAQMRTLRAQGLTYNAIARQVPFCETTVRAITMDVLQEREVGS